MRAEDKQLEGLDLEREEQLQRQEVEDEELRELGGEEVLDVALDHDHDQRGVILGAIRSIFERDSVQVSGLGLPAREAAALTSLQAAVSGREQLGAFVFATDRRDLLEQALAILQPNLTNAEPELLAKLGSMDTLTTNLGVLRAELSNLDEAQEVLNEWDKRDWFGEKAASDETADADDAKDAEGSRGSEREYNAADLSLDGPEREPELRPSTLEGDDLPEESRPPSVYESDSDSAPSTRPTPSTRPIEEQARPSKPVQPASKPAKPRGGRRG